MDEAEVSARLHLAVSAEFYKRGWMYHVLYQAPTDPEAPDTVALLAAYRTGLEEAAKVADEADIDEMHWTIAERIRALIDCGDAKTA